MAKVSPDSILPVRVRRGLTMDDVAKVEEWKLELPGVIVEVEPQRAYPNSRFAAHLLGYVREASDEQLKQGRYRRGDMVGQSGLERLLDEFLRGKDGGERIEVDAMGRQMRLIQSTEPHPGAQVVTTMDRRVQEVAEQAMEGKAGAVVVMDPRNGDVLAMVSTPAFEIDRFTGTIDRNAWLRIIQDPDHPLLNRTIQSQYPPGSVFKIDRRRRRSAGGHAHAERPGAVQRASSTSARGRSSDWKKEGHGSVDLIKGDPRVVRRLLLHRRGSRSARRRSPSGPRPSGSARPPGSISAARSPGSSRSPRSRARAVRPSGMPARP